MRATIVPINKAGELVEECIRLNNPKLAETRRANYVKSVKDTRTKLRASIKKQLIEDGRQDELPKLTAIMKNMTATATRPRQTVPSLFAREEPGWPRLAWQLHVLLDTGGPYVGESEIPRDLNRDLSDARVTGYLEDMLHARWWDSPDPICVTPQGVVINGQHRVAAALKASPKSNWMADYGEEPFKGEGGYFDWTADYEAIPSFVVVWDVEPKAALLMDEARRSTDDRRSIAVRYAEYATIR